MQGRQIERWKQLCEEAATEQDPEKLRELAAEINNLLKQKLTRVKNSDGEPDGRKLA